MAAACARCSQTAAYGIKLNTSTNQFEVTTGRKWCLNHAVMQAKFRNRGRGIKVNGRIRRP